MKKTACLILSGIAIVSSGCTGAASRMSNPTGTLVNTNSPAAIESDGSTGICLSISSKSSLNIDLEGIFDYVQSATALDPVAESEEMLNPWVRWQISF